MVGLTMNPPAKLSRGLSEDEKKQEGPQPKNPEPEEKTDEEKK